MPLYQSGILNYQPEHNFITTFTLFCHIFSNKRGDRGLGSDQTFFILVLIFFNFPHETKKKRILKFPPKRHAAPSLQPRNTPLQLPVIYLSLSCCYQNSHRFCTEFSAKKRGVQDFIFRSIEVRSLFVDAFIFAERRLKSRNIKV